TVGTRQQLLGIAAQRLAAVPHERRRLRRSDDQHAVAEVRELLGDLPDVLADLVRGFPGERSDVGDRQRLGGHVAKCRWGCDRRSRARRDRRRDYFEALALSALAGAFAALRAYLA